MEDQGIVSLYFARSEQAIKETEQKYGAYCKTIAANILTLEEDTEECLNDTLLAAWNSIPPKQPASLRAFLGRLTRDLALTRYRWTHAKKRFSGAEVLLSELSDCLPTQNTIEAEMARAELGDFISAWLDHLPEADRLLFVRRYWYGVPVKQLAAERQTTQNRMAQRLFHLRKSLKAALEQGGITV